MNLVAELAGKMRKLVKGQKKVLIVSTGMALLFLIIGVVFSALADVNLRVQEPSFYDLAKLCFSGWFGMLVIGTFINATRYFLLYKKYGASNKI